VPNNRDEIIDGYAVRSRSHHSVGTLVLLAHARALREEWVRPDEIEPIYLRLPDAQINWAVREARP
jgi:tRNA threonylcarbamoyladenosine biosynthesis protein TsaB